MVHAIIALGVRFRVLVLGLTLVLLGVGVVQLRSAPVDVYPDFAPPQVEIQAEALGLSAQEVEQLITVPLEQDLLNGVPWLDRITSESLPGLSTIDMTFTRGTDLLQARQMVQEHLTQAHALPQVGTPPVMIQPTASTGRVLTVGLTARHISLVDLSVLARWKIKPRLEGLPGVASVAIWGQRDRQLQVQVDPDRLRRHGVTLDQVISSTGNALWVSPLTFVEASTPGTGGFVDTPSQRFGIQHVTPITTARSLSQVTVEDTAGRIVRLGQVGNVVEGHQPLIGDAVLGRTPGLMLVIEKFPGADTRTVTAEVETALDEMKPGLAGVGIDTGIYRPAGYLTAALHDLGVRAVVGLVLVCLLVAGWLLSWRLALVFLLTTATSLVGAAYILFLRGVTFDVTVLAGLVAAIAVAMSEAAVAADLAGRVRGGRSPDEGRAELVEVTRRDRSALMYATIAVLLVPVPALLVGGVAGDFARSVVVSYALAVAVAALVALGSAPAIGSLLLSRPAPSRPNPLPALVRRAYDAVSAPFASSGRVAAGAVAALVLAALAVIPQLGSSGSALPATQDRDLMITWRSAAGTSLPEMTRITGRAVRSLEALDGVAQVNAHVGRALMADRPVDVDSSDIWVALRADAPYAATVGAVGEVVRGYPGMQARITTYPAAEVAAAQATDEPGRALVVRVYGPDLHELHAEAERMRAMLGRIGGVRRPVVQQQGYEPSLQVTVDMVRAQRYGLAPGDIRRAAATYFAGLPVGSLYEDQKIFDVVVWGVPAARRSPADVGGLLLDTPNGGHVRLDTVADVRVDAQPTVIRHSDISRYVDVTADVTGRDLATVIADVRHHIAGMPMPEQFHAEVFSGTQALQSEHGRVLLAALGVAVAVLLLLQLAFGSWRLAVLGLFTVPLGATGAVLTAPAAGGIGSLAAMTAVLAVVALTLRDVVLLLRGGEAAVEDGSGRDAVRGAARDRAPTVVLAALATAAALLPFALGGVVAGTELLQRFAVMVLAGLLTSVAVSLLVVPALCSRLVPRRT